MWTRGEVLASRRTGLVMMEMGYEGTSGLRLDANYGFYGEFSANSKRI